MTLVIHNRRVASQACGRACVISAESELKTMPSTKLTYVQNKKQRNIMLQKSANHIEPQRESSSQLNPSACD